MTLKSFKLFVSDTVRNKSTTRVTPVSHAPLPFPSNLLDIFSYLDTACLFIPFTFPRFIVCYTKFDSSSISLLLLLSSTRNNFSSTAPQFLHSSVSHIWCRRFHRKTLSRLIRPGFEGRFGFCGGATDGWVEYTLLRMVSVV